MSGAHALGQQQATQQLDVMQDDNAGDGSTPQPPPVDWSVMQMDLLHLIDEPSSEQLRGAKFDVYKSVHLYYKLSGLRDEHGRKMYDVRLASTSEEKAAVGGSPLHHQTVQLLHWPGKAVCPLRKLRRALH